MSKLITVFGATGNQGGSVIRALLADPVLSKEFKIRGITRDSSKPAAQELASKGVELVSADLGSVESVASAVKDAHTIFLVTNYWETASRKVEVEQGKNVADAAKAAGVSHLIFSSLINVTEASKGSLPNVPHFDGKAEIERYIRASGVPATFVLPGYFMSSLISSLRKQEDGSYQMFLPVSDAARFPLFDAVSDTGKFVTAAIKNRSTVLGKHIYEAVDYYSPSRIVSEFTEATGKKASWTQIPGDNYKAFLPAAVAQEFLENHLLLEDPGYYASANLEESLALVQQQPTTWKEFVTNNVAKFA
ncbi:NmrA family transcriptional regulator [Talaromyces proteolyticus]|uniref:NmrA family transcriptional regulator n=1 Tax=Talaromyces proteolyticus TaxID=1131652 RepID=A0AAD4Q0F5_9EURO|nr:NmrA family transcriptional regulator [Talaromyces proteolyticus]KAH8697113.1 NmrA family transcriptional regulator [Talaromyces proteolyticus]